MNLADLKAPFAPSKISWRVGSMTQDKTKGMALAYIDARDVMTRLDEVAGVGWQCEYIPMPNGTCCCRIGLYLTPEGANYPEWVWRSNGAMNLTDSEKPDQKEMAEKGSYSDAFKRAAVLWGIGQYLYDIDSPWVALDDKKRIVESEYKRLEDLLAGKQKPTQRETIHGASTLKPEPSGVVIMSDTKRDNARTWALGEIPRIRTMDKASLDKFCERFKKARAELTILDGKASIELEKALADRLEELFS